MIKALRSNIGSIIAGLGFFVLVVITFGDLGNILTDDYWKNVVANITGIGFLTIGLTMVQVSIKQGISEQALQKGLNEKEPMEKMKEHKELVGKKPECLKYLPYFLQWHNERDTKLRKRDFLVSNNFKSEKELFTTKRCFVIRKYKKIRTLITSVSIKWATTDIVYKNNGQIVTLDEHRKARTTKSVFKSLFCMAGMTLLTTGLFLNGESTTTLGEKFITLGTYVIVIVMTSILSIVKEYEKGKFGVPNELDIINEIWREFHLWEVPQWVKNEMDELNEEENKEVKNEETESRCNCGTDIQTEQEESESIQADSPSS